VFLLVLLFFRFYDYQLSDGTPIFSSDADVEEFASPQSTSYAISASPAPMSASLTSPSSSSSRSFQMSPSFIPEFEELGLLTSHTDGIGNQAMREPDNSGSTACPICGNEAGRHVHYGGRACTSCRAFFRRSVQVFFMLDTN
jgi:hypothetical protein